MFIQDKWKCEKCTEHNSPIDRNCRRCWVVRPDWLPERKLKKRLSATKRDYRKQRMGGHISSSDSDENLQPDRKNKTSVILGQSQTPTTFKTNVDEIKLRGSGRRTNVDECKAGSSGFRKHMKEEKQERCGLRMQADKINPKSFRTSVNDFRNSGSRTHVDNVKPESCGLRKEVDEVKPQVDEVKLEVDEVKPQVDKVKPQVDEVKPQVDEVKPESYGFRASVNEFKNSGFRTHMDKVEQENSGFRTEADKIKLESSGCKTQVDDEAKPGNCTLITRHQTHTLTSLSEYKGRPLENQSTINNGSVQSHSLDYIDGPETLNNGSVQSHSLDYIDGPEILNNRSVQSHSLDYIDGPENATNSFPTASLSSVLTDSMRTFTPSPSQLNGSLDISSINRQHSKNLSISSIHSSEGGSSFSCCNNLSKPNLSRTSTLPAPMYELCDVVKRQESVGVVAPSPNAKMKHAASLTQVEELGVNCGPPYHGRLDKTHPNSVSLCSQDSGIGLSRMPSSQESYTDSLLTDSIDFLLPSQAAHSFGSVVNANMLAMSTPIYSRRSAFTAVVPSNKEQVQKSEFICDKYFDDVDTALPGQSADLTPPENRKVMLLQSNNQSQMLSGSSDYSDLLHSNNQPQMLSGSSEYRALCCICMTRPKEASLIHGKTGHQVCCYKCAKRLRRRGKPCPVCRRPIQKVIKNFFV